MNINEIRQYNKEVQLYQSKASELLASKDFRKKELDKLCADLTQLTGQQVTQDNLEDVYTQLMSQFQQTLNTGREIIERAKAEEQSIDKAAMSAGQGTAMGMAGAAGQTAGQTAGQAQPTQTQQAAGFAQGQGMQGQFMGQGFMPYGGFMTPNQMGGVGSGDFGQYDVHGKVGQI